MDKLKQEKGNNMSLPKKGINVAVAQMKVVPGNPRANAEYMTREIQAADTREVDIIVFPELCVPGYVIGDAFEDDYFVDDVLHWNNRIMESTATLKITAIFGSLAVNGMFSGEDGRQGKYNAGYIAQHGTFRRNAKGIPFFCKTLMPKYRYFDDERHFLSLQKSALHDQVPLEDALLPFTLDIRDTTVNLGCIICEDMWDKDYSVSPGRILAKHGIDCLVNISCSPWGWQKNRKRHQIVRDLLADIKVPLIYVNNVGCQNNGKNLIVFDGSSTIYGHTGTIEHCSEPYVAQVVDVVIKESTTLRTQAGDEASDIAQLWAGLTCGISGHHATLPSHMNKVVIGLSGGIDSAVVAAIFAHLYGPENVHCYNMPYEGINSVATQRLASTIAQNLGVQYEVIPIRDMVDLKAGTLGIQSETSQFKTLQAVERMTVLANKAAQLGAFFTCNGNKTETAFGYVTLNGDGRGAIAPLGDLVKGEVYQLGHYLNTEVFGREVIPWECFEIDPMDELATVSRKDPFDYGRVARDGRLTRGYHDEMVRAIVCFRKNPEWFFEKYVDRALEGELKLPPGLLKELFPTSLDFVTDLEEKWRMFWGATFKRVQSVPNIVVSKRAFGYDYRESVMGATYTDRYRYLVSQFFASNTQ